MGLSFGMRHDHLLPFTRWAEIVNIDPWELFALSRVNCLTDSYKAGCGVSWTEYDHQVKNRPSRMSLAQRLFQAEQMVTNHLKTPPGPTYISGEMHTVNFHNRHRSFARYQQFSHTRHHGNETMLKIQTNYRNVIRTGTQVMYPIGHELPQYRTFLEIRDWGFAEDILYCIGTPLKPLDTTGLLDNGIDNLCNLRIYQPGFGPIPEGCTPAIDENGNICYIGDDWVSTDNQRRPFFHHGHRIRPFHATYDGTSLCIQVNKLPNVKLEKYSTLPRSSKNVLDDIDFCDDDSFPETMEVYNVNYEKPDGVAYLRKQPCACTSGCDACQMTEVHICLEPIDPINGEFYVVPIIDTSEEDDEACCWERTTWGKCCHDLYGDPNLCGCDIPIVVCINYVASWCGNWGDCCLPDTVCPELEASVAYLAASMFTSQCECGCLDEIFSYYSTDMMMALGALRSGSTIYAGEKAFQIFGNTRGAYEAYNQIRNIHHIKGLHDFMIG